MPLDFCYTITGHGGQAFEWLDNTGGASATVLTSYGFNLLPGNTSGWQTSSSGSLVLSCPFTLRAHDKLTVIANMLTAHSFPFTDAGFCILLQNGTLKAVLFALRPDGINHIGDLGPIPGTVFPPPGPGVTTTPVIGGRIKAVLGGVEYGKVVDGSDCTGNCSVEITSSDIPGAGTYQLLFGMFMIEQPPNLTKPSAMIVKYVGLA